MVISALEIDGFRNFSHLALQFSPSLNLIVGPNAAGKTSLLEAVYFLGRARSFRTPRVQELIHHEQSAFRLVAMLDGADGRRIPIGVQRGARELIARIDGAAVQSLAQLARQVPVLLLNPNSHRLLEDGPRQRRRFMDWGLFHTEAGFFAAWKRYSLALRNRNAALRTQAADRLMNAWDEELGSAAATLDQLRNTFCTALEGTLQPLLGETLGEVALTLDYRPGWARTRHQTLTRVLREMREQDRRQGYTHAGPHRADLQIRLGGRPVHDFLSRGQQKVLVFALVLAQARLYRKQRGSACILLIDDLPAELDRAHRERVMTWLEESACQLFVTALEADALDIGAWGDARMLSIDRGNLPAVV
jgi:DNA replication and repair protein RecF